jgi:hypothetical protein
MLASELIQVIREDYLDDVTDPCAGDDEDAPYLFSDATLLRYLTEAQRQACRRRDCRHIFDASDPDVCEIELAEDQRSYALDSRILRIERAIIGTDATSTELLHSTVSALNSWDSTWRRTAAGTPVAFIIEGRNLVLDRPPDAALDGETLHLEVWREPLEDLEADAEPEYPGEHRALVHWACHQAYSRRDEEIYNPTAAAEHLALFERAYGPAVEARVIAELLRVPDALSLTPAAIYNIPRSSRAAICVEGW